jgi:hypothetical protein
MTVNTDFLLQPMPKDYRCKVCGASGVQLMRQYACTDPHLTCRDCVAKKLGRPVTTLLADDLPGFWICAVPVRGSEDFWGFSSVPCGDDAWYRLLPAYAGELDVDRGARVMAFLGRIIPDLNDLFHSAVERRDVDAALRWSADHSTMLAVRARVTQLFLPDGVLLRITSADPSGDIVQGEISGPGVVGAVFE